MSENNDQPVQVSGTIRLFQILALAALLMGLSSAYLGWRDEQVGATAPGKVVGINRHPDPDTSDNIGDGFVYAEVVEFTVSGVTHTFENPDRVYPPAHQIGEAVRVRYDPNDLSVAVIDRWVDRWSFPAAVIPTMIIALIGLRTLSKRK